MCKDTFLRGLSVLASAHFHVSLHRINMGQDKPQNTFTITSASAAQ